MDYKNGKIYMIEPTCEYDEGDVYYGSTTSTLVKRLSGHKAKSNSTSSKVLIEKYGRDNIKIVLMELYPCSCKDELKAVEAKYQRENKCVNKRIEGRTDIQYYQDNRDKIRVQRRDYYQANRDKINEQQKEYREANQDKISEYHKTLYQANRDKINEQQKDYYQANKDKIIEQHKEYKQANRDKINARRREVRAEKKLSKHNV